MSELINRLRAESGRFYQRVTGNSVTAAARTAAAQSSTGFVSRYTDADLRDMLLSGSIYRTIADGGARRDVLRAIGRTCSDDAKYPIVAHYNPVPQICGFYANAYSGRLGETLKVTDPDGDPLGDAIYDTIRRIYRWSNFDTRADEMTTQAANQGAVGIRIVYRSEPTPRVYLDLDDSRFIKQVDLDPRGNVVTVYLEYTELDYTTEGVATPVKVEEVISKYGFSKLRNGEESLEPEDRLNPLDLCPYVLLRHKTVAGEVMGRHAYEGTETAIHAINFALSQLDESTLQHVWPYIFATSPAEKPRKIDVNRFTLIYSQTREGMPQPTFEPMVPDLDFEGVLAFAKQRVDWIAERQPQLAMSSLPVLSNISGEALAQLLKAAEGESLRARALIEDAMTRAIQIAMSIGIAGGVDGFNLGTGIGTVEAANRAYDDGQGPMAFKFEKRAALPPTTFQLTQQADAEVAGAKAKFDLAAKAKALGFSQAEVWRTAGKTDAEIVQMRLELGNQTVLDTETDPDGVTLPADEVLA